jgi:hypothetical protein
MELYLGCQTQIIKKVKKRKLNSTNPKYYPAIEKNEITETRKLIAESKKIKAYAVFSYN